MTTTVTEERYAVSLKRSAGAPTMHRVAAFPAKPTRTACGVFIDDACWTRTTELPSPLAKGPALCLRCFKA